MERPSREHVENDLRAELGRRRTSGVAIDETATLQALGLDSAEVLELVADLEDRYHVAIPLNELVSVRTFGQMVDHVHRRLAP